MPDQTSTTNKYRFPWELTTALVLASLNFVVWIWGHDICTLDSETTKHLLKAYEAGNLWQSAYWCEALNTRPYPPLFYVPAMLLFSICGVKTESLALLSLLPFIVLGATGVYGLSRQLQLPRGESASAAFMCATYYSLRLPNVGYIIEYAVAPFVILALWALLRSDFLYKRRASMAFALCCGLGLLAKWLFVIYLAMAVPVVLVLLLVRPQQRLNRAINLGISLALMSAISLPWYCAHHYHSHGEDDGSNFQITFGYLNQSLATDVVFSRQVHSNAHSQAYIGRPKEGIQAPSALENSQDAKIQHNDSRDNQLRRNDDGKALLQRNDSGPALLWRNVSVFIRHIFRYIPSHLAALLILGIIVSGFRAWRAPTERLHTICLLLCLAFPLVLFCIYPNLQDFDPGDAALRYATVLVPLALVYCVIIFPWLSRGRLPLLVALNALTLVFAVGWYFPNTVRLYDRSWLRPTIYGTETYEFADPCGWFTAPKRNALERVAQSLQDWVAKGYQPALVVSLPNHYQPLFALLYEHNRDIPLATYERGHWQYISSYYQHPIEPGQTWRQRPVIYVYQNHWRRQDTPERLARNFNDNCHEDRQSLATIQQMLRSHQLDCTKSIISPRHSCREVYYFSTIAPQVSAPNPSGDAGSCAPGQRFNPGRPNSSGETGKLRSRTDVQSWSPESQQGRRGVSAMPLTVQRRS